MSAQQEYANEDQELEQNSASDTTGASAQIDVEAIVDAIAKNPKLLGRLAQSASDRTQAKIEPQIEGLRGQLAELKRLQGVFGSEEAALEFMEFRNQRGQPQTSIAQQPVSQETKFDADAAYKALGGDPNEPDYIRMYRSGPVTPARLIQFMQAKQEKTSMPASQQMPNPGSGSAPTINLDADYEAAAKKLRPGDVDAQMRLLRLYRERAKKEGISFSY